MGIYVRRSITAGPFRFNVSRSGLGVSTGVPGFRVGSGPRGNFVSVGGNGVQYRTTVNPQVSPRSAAPALAPTPAPPRYDVPPGSIPMEDVTGATAMSLTPTGDGDVVDQLNAAARSFRWGWPVAIIAFVIGLATFPFGMIAWALAVPLCWWLFLRDAAKRSVVLFYELDGSAERWFETLASDWSGVTGSEKVWRIVQAGQVSTTHQLKSNAGAAGMVERVAVAVGSAGPKVLSTNVSVPSFEAGKAGLYLLPDRILVREGKHFTDVSYERLHTRGFGQRFVEKPGPLPRDARQIDRTWQHVNVKGGPDRRYKDNRELPVMLYGGLELRSGEGLDWRIQTSDADASMRLARAIEARPLFDGAR